ncbi:MAG TPA: hypothetical protein VIN61_03460 [Gammaproteobacteria bacterium]
MRDGFRGAAAAFTAFAVLVPVVANGQSEPPPERIAGEPNLNGIWQALNTAYWNLEAHSAEALKDFWELGAIAAIPAGQSVITGDGKIPYLPEALAKRDENRAGWPKTDPETYCYLPGIPRATYMPFPFQIVQAGGGDDILFIYEYASANRLVEMNEHKEPPVDTWMGQSNGHWEGDTLVIETTGFNGRTWLDRAGNHHSSALKVTERITRMGPNHLQYEATLEDPNTYSRPWTISMPLYRRIEPNAQLLEFKCVPFAEELMYKDLELTE